MTLDEIKQAVREGDPELSEDDEAFHAAVVIMSLFSLRSWSAKAVADFTGYPLKEVKKFLWHLRANKVVRGHKVHHSGWDDNETGAMAFWLDVSIALGFLARVNDTPAPSHR